MKTEDIKTVTTLGAMAGANEGLDFALEVQAEMERMGYLNNKGDKKKVLVEPRAAKDTLAYGDTKSS